MQIARVPNRSARQQPMDAPVAGVSNHQRDSLTQ
jgi:hypothetical protein